MSKESMQVAREGISKSHSSCPVHDHAGKANAHSQLYRSTFSIFPYLMTMIPKGYHGPKCHRIESLKK